MDIPKPDLKGIALDAIEDCLESWSLLRTEKDLQARAASELLFAWGNAIRLISTSDIAELLSRVEECTQRDKVRILNAVQSQSTSELVQKIQNIDQALSYWLDPHEEAEIEVAAGELLDSIDRRSVILCMAQRLATREGPQWIEELRQQVAEEELAFEDHLDLFVAEGSRASALLNAARDDLAETDFDLWETLGKFRRLEEWIEENEQAEYSISASDKQDIQDHMLKSRIVLIPFSDRSIRSYSQSIFKQPLMAAAEHRTRSQINTLAWVSPDGNTVAKCTFDAEKVSGESERQIRLVFYEESSGQRAEKLAGTVVHLGDCSRTIDAEAGADFNVAELRQSAGSGLLLLVAGKAWEASPEGS